VVHGYDGLVVCCSGLVLQDLPQVVNVEALALGMGFSACLPSHNLVQGHSSVRSAFILVYLVPLDNLDVCWGIGGVRVACVDLPHILEQLAHDVGVLGLNGC